MVVPEFIHSDDSAYCCLNDLMTFISMFRLAWERGLVVALLAGTIQAMHSANGTGNNTSCAIGESKELVLKLLCQLHTCRYNNTCVIDL